MGSQARAGEVTLGSPLVYLNSKLLNQKCMNFVNRLFVVRAEQFSSAYPKCALGERE